MRTTTLLVCLFIFTGHSFSPTNSSYQIKILASGIPTEIRGLSVVNDKIIWVSGSNGWIGKSDDEGKSWMWQQVKGYQKLDFRDVEAFDENNAIIANAGTPAYILKTTDGGNTWKVAYENHDSLAFIDGLDFWDVQKGIAYADPIGGNFLILSTNNGGAGWELLPRQQSPEAFPGEASFAASGTGIRTLKGGHVWMATGGTRSRVLYSSDYGHSWASYHTPVLQGNASQGIFSLLFFDLSNGIIVGGDYRQDTLRTQNCFITRDGGKTWNAPSVSTSGFRSCIERTNEGILIATGTSGTDISTDGGERWVSIDKHSYHVVRKAKNGKAIYIAGANGRIGKIVLP